MNYKNFYIIIGILLVFSSCGSYQKLLKNPDPEVKYQAALVYYGKQDYTKAVTLLEDVSSFYKGTEKAENILYLLSSSYFNQKDYVSATHYYKLYVSSYLRGGHYEECLYMEAFCYYKESPIPKLDQTATTKGIEKFKAFIETYPNSDYAPNAKKYVIELEEKLAERELLNTKTYFNIGNYRGNNYYRAAIVTAENALKDYPDSQYAEDFSFLIVQSKYEEAVQSVAEKATKRSEDALDECYYFLREYPKTEQKREIQRITNYLQKILKKQSNL